MIVAVALSLFLAPAATTVDADSSYLMIRVEQKPTYVGTPRECAEPNVVCMMELQDAKVSVVRNFGGKSVPKRLLVRSSGHHHYVPWRRGNTLLIRAVPFVDGTIRGWYADYWQPVWGGEACVTEIEATSFVGSPFGEVFARGSKRLAEDGNRYWEAGEKLICVDDIAKEQVR